MKLKKIASLALAGIMAVSMLAGCKGSETENNGTEGEQNQVVAASVADYANNLMAAAQKNVFKFENSSELTEALKKVASDSTVLKSDAIKAIYEDLTYAGLGDVAIVNDDLKNNLKDELDLDIVCDSANASGKGLATVTEEGERSIGYVYVASGKLTEAAAVQLIGGYFVDSCVDNDDYFPAKVAGTKDYKCDYTAEISAVKVTAADTDKNSAWVIAIVVTQNAVEVSNG